MPRPIHAALARPGVVIALALVLLGASGLTFAAAANTGRISACVNNSSGTLHIVTANETCAANEVLLSWNVEGPAGPPGPTGPQGPMGMTGPAGGGLTYHTESRMSLTVPTTFTSMLHLDLPAGSYVVSATVLANNLGVQRVPVLCVIAGPSESSVISGVQLEPEVPQTEGRASGATLPVSLATSFAIAGRLDLQCVSNTGPGGATAEADQMQLTAETVAGIARQ